MRVLDKNVNPIPWDKLTEEQRDRLVASNKLAPWMFERRVVLTLCDDKDGPAQQFNAVVSLEPIIEPKPSIITRFQNWVKRGSNDTESNQ